MLLHLLFLNLILAVSFLLRARSLRLLATLDARAFIMLTLAELGKRTRFGARTLETAQRAVNRFIFLDADLRHSFPRLSGRKNNLPHDMLKFLVFDQRQSSLPL